jgi:hypothetical protein
VTQSNQDGRKEAQKAQKKWTGFWAFCAFLRLKRFGEFFAAAAVCGGFAAYINARLFRAGLQNGFSRSTRMESVTY